jgi:hypothetical protein
MPEAVFGFTTDKTTIPLPFAVGWSSLSSRIAPFNF